MTHISNTDRQAMDRYLRKSLSNISDKLKIYENIAADVQQDRLERDIRNVRLAVDQVAQSKDPLAAMAPEPETEPKPEPNEPLDI